MFIPLAIAAYVGIGLYRERLAIKTRLNTTAPKTPLTPTVTEIAKRTATWPYALLAER